MNRRNFLASLIASATLDPEKALWVQGRKSISIPASSFEVIWVNFKGCSGGLIPLEKLREIESEYPNHSAAGEDGSKLFQWKDPFTDKIAQGECCARLVPFGSQGKFLGSKQINIDLTPRFRPTWRLDSRDGIIKGIGWDYY